MKKITVIIQPAKLENLKKKLAETGVRGVTITGAEGYGVAKRNVKVARAEDAMVEFLPKAKLEIVVKDAEVDKVVGSVIEVTRTGRIGDGKIFITGVEEAIRIRTGERGEDAI